jgi:hypothetical protein
VARIVGKGGSNIHRIQDACGKVFIRSPPRDAEAHEDGTVSFQIKGKAALCFQAYELIQAELAEAIAFSAAEFNLGRPNDVAALVGPGGASIRSIMSTTNTKVVTRPREERSDLVVIEGLPEDVKRAYELVFETIEKNKREKEETPYRSSRSVAPPAAEKAEKPARQPREQAKKTYKKEESAGDSSSNDTQKWGAPKAPKYAGSAKSPSPAPPVTAAAAGAAGAAAPGENGDATEKVDEVRIEVPFPADKTGLIFGKEGATVKHIKRKSRARVHVDTKKLVVELRGSQAQVDAAKHLIADILAREPKHKPEAAAGAAGAAAVAAPAEPKAQRAAPAEAKGAEQQK